MAMSMVHRLLEKFSRDQRGNIAILFGVAFLPIAGASGVALDAGRASNVKSYLQAEVDSAALAGARAAAQIVLRNLSTDKGTVSQYAVTNASSVALSRYTNSAVTGVTVSGTWLNSTDFEVSASASVRKGMSLILSPGGNTQLAISAKAVARVTT
jgi:Flp pilus assembly protein TadG